jgi:hypothetical protein
MIVEIVEFRPEEEDRNRDELIAAARQVIPKWQANPDLIRKHFLIGLEGAGGIGLYIWPSIEAAKAAHDDEWLESVIAVRGYAPTIRYYDMFLLIDNEAGTATEFPATSESGVT